MFHDIVPDAALQSSQGQVSAAIADKVCNFSMKPEKFEFFFHKRDKNAEIWNPLRQIQQVNSY